MELCFVSPSSKDYAMLAKKLDDYYISLVGDVHLRYAKVNDPKNMACIIVAYEGKTPIGCGCWKAVDDSTAEVKRIYVEPQHRRRGVATAIIELKPDRACTEEDIMAFCSGLPRYKRPKKIIFADVPRNPTGKIEKPRLREMYCGESLVASQIHG